MRFLRLARPALLHASTAAMPFTSWLRLVSEVGSFGLERDEPWVNGTGTRNNE